MKVFSKFLVILVALHSCSAFYSPFQDSEAGNVCPQKFAQIEELATNCGNNILSSFEISSKKTDEFLYKNYVMWVN